MAPIMSGLLESHARQNQTEFYTKYLLEDLVGEGSFGTVRLARNRNTQEVVAVKCIKRDVLEEETIIDLRNEVLTMMKFKHPHSIQLLHVFDDDPEYFFMVMEYASGGELFERIVQKSFYTEVEARKVISQVASCLSFMHSKGIVHRDLKPENLVYSTPDDSAPLKLIDFGFAKVLDQHEKLSEICGSPGYCAPEVLLGEEYRFSCDVWSLGIIMYTLLAGYQPFYHEDPDIEEQRILHGDLHFPEAEFDCVSVSAMELIRGMLQVDPSKRLTVQQVAQHEWCLSKRPSGQLTRAKSGMASMMAKKRWKKALIATRAISRARLCATTRSRSFEILRPKIKSMYSASTSSCPGTPPGSPHPQDWLPSPLAKSYGLHSYGSATTAGSSDDDEEEEDEIQLKSTFGRVTPARFSLTSVKKVFQKICKNGTVKP